MAHITGFYNGNIYYRLARDANHHMVPLVFGYVLGNESKDVHEACNEFTNDALPKYDIPSRVDVSDGDKGQYEAFLSTMMNATPFLCMNHGKLAGAFPI